MRVMKASPASGFHMTDLVSSTLAKLFSAPNPKTVGPTPDAAPDSGASFAHELARATREPARVPDRRVAAAEKAPQASQKPAPRTRAARGVDPKREERGEPELEAREARTQDETAEDGTSGRADVVAAPKDPHASEADAADDVSESQVAATPSSDAGPSADVDAAALAAAQALSTEPLQIVVPVAPVDPASDQTDDTESPTALSTATPRVRPEVRPAFVEATVVAPDSNPTDEPDPVESQVAVAKTPAQPDRASPVEGRPTPTADPKPAPTEPAVADAAPSENAPDKSVEPTTRQRPDVAPASSSDASPTTTRPVEPVAAQESAARAALVPAPARSVREPAKKVGGVGAAKADTTAPSASDDVAPPPATKDLPPERVVNGVVADPKTTIDSGSQGEGTLPTTNSATPSRTSAIAPTADRAPTTGPVPTTRVAAESATPSAAPNRASTWPATVEKLLERLHGEVSMGKREFRIDLAPPELGRLNVRLTERPEGLVVRFLAERGDVAAALKNELPRLEQSLSLSGLSLASLDVQARGGQGSQADPRNHDGARTAGAAERTSSRSEARTRHSVSTSARSAVGRVDLIV